MAQWPVHFPASIETYVPQPSVISVLRDLPPSSGFLRSLHTSSISKQTQIRKVGFLTQSMPGVVAHALIPELGS